MARLSHRYTQERSEERVRNFKERRLRRRGDHEDQSTYDESEESESPSVNSTVRSYHGCSRFGILFRVSNFFRAATTNT